MPKLQDLRQTKKISLPSYAGSEVEIYDSVLVNELTDVEYNSTNNIGSLIVLLPKLIKSWNFVDDNEKVLPINAETLGLLKQSDLKFMLDEINNFSEEVKKKLNA